MSSSNPLALPPTLSPDALDTQTELTEILNRFRAGIQAASSSGAGGITGATPNMHGASPDPASANKDPLRIFSTQTDALKHKIQRARAQTKGLPDMERDIEEQEAEIKDLEEKIRLQRQVLEGLRERGMKFGTEGEKMDTD